MASLGSFSGNWKEIVDSQTRHALKQDKFVQATQGSVSWLAENRVAVLRYLIPGVILIALAIVAGVVYAQRSRAAETALGAAIDVYSAPLAQPGAPAEAGTYASTADRARAAHKLFQQIVDQYKMLPQAAKAHYFLGLTDEDLGNNAAAESELKQAASAWNGNLVSLANYALAGLYHQTGRDALAVALYQQLSSGKGTSAVPAFNAELALADLYSAEGKKEQAMALWAKVKDEDKSGAAGEIAAQKLPAQN
jgi:tetratricopeptide (TPR) repeat protein